MVLFSSNKINCVNDFRSLVELESGPFIEVETFREENMVEMEKTGLFIFEETVKYMSKKTRRGQSL